MADTHQKFAVLFPGQGAQYAGMGRDFAEQFPEAKSVFDRADEILGFSLSKVCFEGPETEIHSTRISQPALFAMSAAVLEVLKGRGVDLSRASLAAGLSLGEYTALYFAGSLSFEEGLKLVAQRGEWMQEACDERPSGMISVLGLRPADAEAVCKQASDAGVIAVSNVNSPEQVVLSGEKGALAKAETLAKERGARRTIALKVAGAYHSPLMASAEEKMRHALAETRIGAPSIPILSNVTADYVRAPGEIKELLARQVTSTVRWAQSMERACADGVLSFYEIGAGTVLAGLLRKTCSDAKTTSIGTVDDLEKLDNKGEAQA